MVQGSTAPARSRVPVGERAVYILAEVGPGLGRPLVDTPRDSNVGNLKELRLRSGRDVAIRVMFVFDSWSQAVLLVAGNKAGNWTRW